MTSQEPESTSIPTRRPYHGSCHCGFMKYVAYLTLPPPLIAVKPPPTSTTRILKCNCSTCHKMSFFHVRLMNSPNDFRLLSPTDPVNELKDYTCFDHEIHWYFCPTCAVRCFSICGESEVVEVEIEGLGKKKVWKPKTEGWIEEKTGYLSVNAATLDPDQEGLDLREWTKRGWIVYLDTKNDESGNDETARLGRPHDGGMY